MVAIPALAALPPPFVPILREASLADLPALLRLENRAFTEDRLSRRSFQHLLTRGNAARIVALDPSGGLLGYALVLFRRGTSLARLYSIAVDPDHGGRGLGGRLLEAGEAQALARDALYMRLEVRPDNIAAIALYRRCGYHEFGRFLDYYEDHAAALRFEKRLLPAVSPPIRRVQYYPQSTEFTCGPAALLMAMKALLPEIPLDPRLELRLWRESTTVFMTSGPGGTDPYGLALSASRRGLHAEVHVSEPGLLFLDGVRNETKKRIMALAQEDLRQEVAGSAVVVRHHALGHGEMLARVDRGAVPIILISGYRMYHEKEPHWVVVTAHDERFVFVHDPFIDPDEEEDTAVGKVNVPIPHAEFERMARYGRSQLRAAIVISRPDVS